MRLLLRRSGLTFLIFWVLQKSAAQQGITFPHNPHSYWYILSPTAFGPPPRKAVLQNGMLGLWQYQKTTGRGNTYTIGLIPTLLLGESYMPVWASGHRRFPIGGSEDRPVTTLNVGGFFLSLPASEEQTETDDFSLLYLNFTFGNREKNFAIGAAVVPTGLSIGNCPPALTLHGMTRLGRRSCLLTENYLLYSRSGWIPCSLSGWRGWRKRTSIDVAMMLMRIPAGMRASNQSLWLPIPWLSVHHTLRHDIFQSNED